MWWIGGRMFDRSPEAIHDDRDDRNGAVPYDGPMDLEDFAIGLPKTELHLHIEGTLEPELMFQLAARNGVALPYRDIDSVRTAYEFTSLQSFLDIYYRGAGVLVTEQDFYDLASAYLERAAADNVRHVEMFFDPQTHTVRGVPMADIVGGLRRAIDDASERHDITGELVMCFLRHLPADEAMETLEAALPHRSQISSIGLDSSEVGHPPSKFKDVFGAAADAGFSLVAHAGEEGPPAYVWEAVDVLGVKRIDHGVRSLEDASLVKRLVADRIPLTVCPLSNVRLRVVETMGDHVLPAMVDAGLLVSVNSDDPAYFGGYVGANYAAVAAGLDLDAATLTLLAHNSVESSFLPESRKAFLAADIDRYARSWGV